MTPRSAHEFENSPVPPGKPIAVMLVVTVIPAARGLRGDDRNDPPYGGSRNG